MSASTAIGMVSESLRNMLIGEMTLSPAVNVTILAPDEGGGERRVNLFLYKVQENPFLRNLDWQVKPGSPDRLVPPPLTLTLSYLMTAYATNDPQTGNTTAHEILGEAMRVFYEHPILPKEYLVTGLSNAREQVKIVQNTLDPEELSHVWNTFTQPFRLSVLYQLSVVQLDVLSESEQVMAKRVRKIGVPDVRAPFHPPVVNDIDPISGAAGAVITLRGEHLAGWKGYVTMMGTLVLNGHALTGDTFTMTAPAGLSQGFYEIKVDISGLFRRTFFFEVTP